MPLRPALSARQAPEPALVRRFFRSSWHRRPRWTAPLLVGLLLFAVASAPPRQADASGTGGTAFEEPWNSGWSLHVDNDLFAFLNRDQQYTGGISLELAGRRAAEASWSLDPLLEHLDRWTTFSRFAQPDTTRTGHSMILGLAAFTPEDISAREPLEDERPYASLVVVANARQVISPARNVSYLSRLELGLLGTNLPQQFQNFFHDLGGSERAQGWSNQISHGGEPTFRYLVGRQVLHQAASRDGRFEWRTDTRASVGYITQIGAGATVRWGRLRRPWWTFSSGMGDYLMLDGAVVAAAPGTPRQPEWFLWAGLEGEVRAFNALLQGQFRDSAVTFERSELRSLLAEAAFGVAADVGATGVRTGFEIRWRTNELRDAGGEAPIWGRVFVSRLF
jgi:hypothetical protein